MTCDFCYKRRMRGVLDGRGFSRPIAHAHVTKFMLNDVTIALYILVYRLALITIGSSN